MRNNSFFRGAALVALATVASAGAANAELKANFKPAPEFSDGDLKFKVRGRVMYDVFNVNVDRDATAPDHDATRTSLRRARIGVEGQFDKRWKYKAEVTLRDGASEWEDVYVEYVGDNYSLVLGNNKLYAPLEEATSSRYITFNERSMITNAADTGRFGGLALVTGGANWSFVTGAYGDSINTSTSNDEYNGAGGTDTLTEFNEQFSVAARGSWAPIMTVTPEGATVLHVGASVRYRDNGSGSLSNIRARPAGLGLGPRYIEAGANSQDMTYGVEALGILGPFSVQGEYILIDGKQIWAGGDETQNSGYYVDAIWNITGESRAYKGSEGVVNRLVPAAPLAEGGMGAWQAGVRYESVDFSEGSDSDRGEQTGWTVGLNWFPSAYVGFKLNYAKTEFDIAGANGATRADGEAEVVSLRTQFDF